MPKDFLSKLKFISWERDLTPWLGALGLAKGSADDLKKGRAPSGEFLLLLQRAERVNLAWLDGDEGAPFRVMRLSAEAALSRARERLVADWSCCWVTAGDGRYLLLLWRADVIELERKGPEAEPKRIEYTQAEVIDANLGVAELAALAADWLPNILQLTPDDVARLGRGEMGNLELFGWEDGRKRWTGLVKRMKIVTQAGPAYAEIAAGACRAAAEPPGDSLKDLTARERALIAKYREMPEPDQAHVQAVVGAFADQGRCGEAEAKG